MLKVALLLLALAAACTHASPSPGDDPIPDRPTYIDDVAPILATYCAGCHAAPAAPTATSESRNCIRTDRWDSSTDPMMLCTDTATAGSIFGVHDGGPMIADNVLTRRMPLSDAVLTDRELLIVQRWRDAGYPKRANDQPPTLQFVTPPAGGVTVCNPDCTYGIQYIASDTDGDSIAWSLGWTGGGKQGVFATGLASGSGTVKIDATALASGTYTLTATLDDGTLKVAVDAAGTLTVPAGHNAAPTVTVLTPNGGESYYDTQPITITFQGADPDDAMLTYDVSAVGATTIPIQTLTAPVGQAQVSWTPPTVTALTGFRIAVTARDGGTPQLTATDQSDADFTISPPPQAVSFAGQLQPILTANCTGAQCHDAIQPASGLKLVAGAAYTALVGVAATEAPCTAYQLVFPGQPAQSYLIFKLAGSGTCFSGSRMPKGAAALTAAQIQLFRDWIANGAPNN